MTEASSRGWNVAREEAMPLRPLEGGAGTIRVPVDRRVGSKNLLQEVLRLHPAASIVREHETSEEVIFVAQGQGEARLGGKSLGLEPGTALFVPVGESASIRNGGSGEMALISVLSPQPGDPLPPAPEAPLQPIGSLTVHERDQPRLPAGPDRHFKVLIDPTRGCRNVTQFVGFIERSRAPVHFHTYEEAIYVLRGEGLAHVEGRTAPIGPGTSIFLSPGVRHCLENSGEEVLGLLGVFSPAGDPSNRKAPSQ